MTDIKKAVTKRCNGPADAARFLRQAGFKQSKDDDDKVIWKRVRNNRVQIARSQRRYDYILITISVEED